MEDSNKKISLLQQVVEMKNQMEKNKVSTYNHVIFGLEVDADGRPTCILNSIEGGGYTGLGMLDCVQLLLDEARTLISKGFKDIIEDESKKALIDIDTNGIPPEVVKRAAYSAAEDLKNANKESGADPIVIEALEKYQDDIVEALTTSNDKLLEETKRKIIEHVRSVKGSDYNPEFLFGLGGSIQPKSDKTDKPESFDVKNIKKFF